jgi:hypothetical protein
MTAAPFDTLKLSRQLREQAHFSQDQAEGVAEALARGFPRADRGDNGVTTLTEAIVSAQKNDPEGFNKCFPSFG